MTEHDLLPPAYSRIAVALLVIVGVVLCYLITAPFIAALVWSFTLAVLFTPVERMIRGFIPIAGVSVACAMMLAAVLVVAPVIFVSAALIESVIASADVMGEALSINNWQALAHDYPGLASALEWVDGHLNLAQLMQTVTARLESWGTRLVLGSVTGLLNLLLTFYFLFYMLRDRGWIIAAIGRKLPLSDGEYGALAQRLQKTVYASVYGTAAVSALQGLLGGLVFWWLDLPSPIFWGVIMGLLGIVPFLGAFIVWVPASIALAMSGQWLSAVILAVWGTFIVGLIDNIVYPILVGRQLALHSMLSFIAIVGGILVFGAHGFVLGPLIVAGTQSLLETLRSRIDGGFAAASQGTRPG